jgi:hypothetical protein
MGYDRNEKIIVYDCVGVAALLCSTFVAVTLLKVGLRAGCSRLLFYFHLSFLFDIGSLFPYIYGTDGWCIFFAFLHYYSVIANCCVFLLLVVYYRNLIFPAEWVTKLFSRKWGIECASCVFPLISLLPFSTNSYGSIQGLWCGFKTDENALIWEFLLYGAIVVCLILSGSAVFLATFYQVYHADKELAKQLLSTIGIYCFLSSLTLTIRIILEFFTDYYSGIAISGSAILFFLVFLREKKSMALFESQSGQDPALRSEGSDSLISQFSWEDERFSFTIATRLVALTRQNSTSRSVDSSHQSTGNSAASLRSSLLL